MSAILTTLLVALLGGLALVLLVALRLLLVLPRGAAPPPAPRPRDRPASLAVFLGSGGHTAEMRALLAAVDYQRYAPRIYVYGAGDEMSLRSVAELETAAEARAAGAVGVGHRQQYSLLALPRARKVGEGKLSTLLSASKTFAVSGWHCFLLPLVRRPREPWTDVLLLNGPGTGVVLVLVLYIRRILGLSYTRIIYVESFARVRSLSLSGRLLRPFVDKFVVQWPNAAGPPSLMGGPQVRKEANGGTDLAATAARPGAAYRGWLV